jgi:hypothetical protein
LAILAGAGSYEVGAAQGPAGPIPWAVIAQVEPLGEWKEARAEEPGKEEIAPIRNTHRIGGLLVESTKPYTEAGSKLERSRRTTSEEYI